MKLVSKHIDVLVLGGGNDLPFNFKESIYPKKCSKENLKRINFERKLIDEFCKNNKPIFGFCYGLQLFCLHFGGELKSTDGHGEGLPKTKEIFHKVIIDNSSIFPNKEIIVSSNHKMSLDIVPEDFKITGYSDDEVIESVENNNFVGVQWHPELDSTKKYFLKYLDRYLF